MIPSIDKPKYKPLVRLKIGIWNRLEKKKLKKKKWRSIIFFIKKKYKYNKKKNPISLNLINYYYKRVSKFPVYRRYRYQKELFLRKQIQIIYGRLQSYKIKQLALKGAKQGRIGLATELEQKSITFLYRLKLLNTYSEGKVYYNRKHIIINNNYKQLKIKKGDILHFSPFYEKILRRRIIKHYLYWQNLLEVKFSNEFGIYEKNLKKKKKKFRKKKGKRWALNQSRKNILNTQNRLLFLEKRKRNISLNLVQNVDFDVNSIRFVFLNNIKYFKNHPFRIPFERVMRWYTRT